MVATSIEQAKRLTTAGVSPESADMCWALPCYVAPPGVEIPPKLYVEPYCSADIAPAWSLGKLWDILHSLDKTYIFETQMSSEELIEHLVTLICIRFENR